MNMIQSFNSTIDCPETMEIRYITSSDDRKAISRIYEESWRYTYRGLIPQSYLDAIPAGRWVNNLDIPGLSTMVCLENGAYIGTSSFCRSRFEQYPNSGEVISIYLLPEYMRKGYGRRLLGARNHRGCCKQSQKRAIVMQSGKNVRAREVSYAWRNNRGHRRFCV